MEEKRVIYGDWAATSPVCAEAAEAMRPFLFGGEGEEWFGNPSSLHDLGQAAKEAVRQGRAQTARLIGADPEELFFTSCATESINWAIKGTAFRALAEGSVRRRFLVSAVEHPAVLRTCESLAPLGFRTDYSPVDGNGVVSLEALRRMMGEDCLLCAVMHANNETGVLQPASECAELAHANGALFLCDGVQTVGHIPVDVKALGCDFLSLSGHKLGAPKGIGALYIKKGIALYPILHGGGQENGMRSGTENVPGIVGLGCACRLCEEEGLVYLDLSYAACLESLVGALLAETCGRIADDEVILVLDGIEEGDGVVILCLGYVVLVIYGCIELYAVVVATLLSDPLEVVLEHGDEVLAGLVAGEEYLLAALCALADLLYDSGGKNARACAGIENGVDRLPRIQVEHPCHKTRRVLLGEESAKADVLALRLLSYEFICVSDGKIKHMYLRILP